MQPLEPLPEPVKAVHLSLEPFLKQRQKVAQIRRILAIDLGSHLNREDGIAISQPLSLVQSDSNVGSAPSVRGLRREYLRCIRSNIKAREEYQKIGTEHHAAKSQHLENSVTSKDQDASNLLLNLFLDVVKYRERHERLRILQDYVDTLAQKPAAAVNHLEPQIVLKNVDSLPPVPSDIFSSAGLRLDSQGMDLKELVERLEKSVLRAKLLLKSEQKLLARVRMEGQSHSIAPIGSGRRLQALGTARNALISWIETELSKAGESGGDIEDEENFVSTEKKEKNYIDSQLSLIQRKYAQYVQARQALTIAATGSMDVPAPTPTQDDTAEPTTKVEVETATPMSHVLQPYLDELTSISSQQKSMIQQKSHLTISLSKQLKESSRGLDRLAGESHLLPAYPLGSQLKGMKSSPSFADETASHEKPDSCHRARAWVHASEVATIAIKEAVADKLEEGQMAISDARQALLEVLSLLGEDVDAGTGDGKLPEDIWTTLDCSLGVIKRDGIEV